MIEKEDAETKDTYGESENIENINSEILEVIENHRKAAETSDADILAKFLHKDFIHINSKGHKRTLKEHLELYRSGAIVIESIEMTDHHLRVYGNTAVFNCIAQAKESFDDENRSGTYRLSRVYIKEEDSWLCVLNHGHKIAG